MPELKSVIAGLAISTAMTGGVVGLGAATTAASAATQVGASASMLTGGGCRGWGWCGGHRRHHRMHIRLNVFNRNFNQNDHFNHERRHDRHWDKDDRSFYFKPQERRFELIKPLREEEEKDEKDYEEKDDAAAEAP
ncbi:hypothetical protein ABGB18_28130 [Nonomuraea sp. B12E4]|uniref:hypothetical protein n=1 Tax=Nonomuraea sp. B12E4 TaxID=3153564 RepID=UPI00325E5396